MSQGQVINVTPSGSPPADAIGSAQLDFLLTQSLSSVGMTAQPSYFPSIQNQNSPLFEEMFSLTTSPIDIVLPAGVTTLVIYGPVGNVNPILITANTAAQTIQIHPQAPFIWCLPTDTFLTSQTFSLSAVTGTVNPVIVVAF